MAKERIYELAKELKMPSKDLVNMANRQGMGVKSHMSSVTPDQAQQLRQLAKGGQKTTNNQHQPVTKNDGHNKQNNHQAQNHNQHHDHDKAQNERPQKKNNSRPNNGTKDNNQHKNNGGRFGGN